MEAVCFFVEVLPHRPRADQFPVEVVRPAVVRAFEFSLVATVFQADERSTMPADIGECPDFSVFTPHDDGGLVCQAEYQVVARVRDLRGMAGQDPVPRDDTIQLQLIDLGIGIKALIECPARLLAGDQVCDGCIV